jgi:hypothetical protein
MAWVTGAETWQQEAEFLGCCIRLISRSIFVTEHAETSFQKLFSEGRKPERRSRTFFSGISTTNTPFDQILSHSLRPENSTSDTHDIFSFYLTIFSA